MGKARPIGMLVFPFWARLLPGGHVGVAVGLSILDCILAVCFTDYLVSHPVATSGESWDVRKMKMLSVVDFWWVPTT